MAEGHEAQAEVEQAVGWRVQALLVRGLLCYKEDNIRRKNEVLNATSRRS